MHLLEASGFHRAMWVAALWLLAVPAAEPTLVDMVVAAVDGAPITLSELVAETRLTLLRVRDPQTADTAALTGPLLGAVLQSIVNRALLLGEVRRLQLREVPEQEVKKALEPIKRKFLGATELIAFLERSGFEPVPGEEAPAALLAILKSELEVERFLDVRVRLSVKADEADLRACYEANKDKLGRRPFSEVEPRIRERVLADREEAAIAELLTQLKARAVIIYTPGYEPAPRVDADDPLLLRCPKREPRR